MPTQAQVDAVTTYLQQQFTSATVSPATAERRARFQITTSGGGFLYELQVDERVFDAYAAPEQLAAYLADHRIGQRLRECGRGGVITIPGPNAEPDCTPNPLAHESTLLGRIRTLIQGAFPSERLDEDTDALTHTHIFRFGTGTDGRGVEVTELFLDADDGLDAALRRLDQWSVSRRIAQLQPGHVLVITNDGPTIR